MTVEPNTDISEQIYQLALDLGADKVGLATLYEDVEHTHLRKYDEWLEKGHNGEMQYMSNHTHLRQNPASLLEGARSMIIIAVSYYPSALQPSNAPQISKYAYGRDYHKVLKKLLNTLGQKINDQIAPHDYRVCIDTAPILERYWAHRSGVGFIGRNKNIIAPKIGSYVFLGELLTTLSLTPTDPITVSCSTCRRCIDACPMDALSMNEPMKADRCISYLTIEHRGEISDDDAQKFGTKIYGCDICQDVCPYNRKPIVSRLFEPSEKILSLRREDITDLTEEKYGELFFGTAATRAKYDGMRRNAEIYLRNNPIKGPKDKE